MKWRGKSLSGVDPVFLGKVAAAAQKAGASYVYVISGKRTPATNTGVANSNHLTGHAIDAWAYVPGTGKVPLGTLLQQDASSYGLRSGDQPGFYKGGPDVNHVDDGSNVNGGKPLPLSASAPPVPPPQGATYAPTPAAQTQPAQPAGPDPALQQDIGNIPQLPGPPVADVALSGSFDPTPAAPMSTGQSTWQMIASQGQVSPETLRLAQVAGYGDGTASG